MRSEQRVLRRQNDSWQIEGRVRVRGTLCPPADKSILHRALLLAAVANGRSRIQGLPGEDVLRTAQALRQLGIEVQQSGTSFEVWGRGLRGLSVSRQPIDCGNSGTTMRLLAGLLAAQPFRSTLTGDASLLKRPMQRVATPLRAMGASIATCGEAGRPPLVVGRQPNAWLRGMDHHLAIDSAQVRTAILLAGLYAQGPTRVTPGSAARDHTQRMLRSMGLAVQQDPSATLLYPTTCGDGFAAFDCSVPGDASSAAFSVALASALPHSRLRVEDCSLNPGRIRYLDVLRASGAAIETAIRNRALGEPSGQVRVQGRKLRAITLAGEDLVACIDEVPALAAAGAIAGCEVRVRDASELRHKESDRIAGLVEILRCFGGTVQERRDGFTLAPHSALRRGRVSSQGDHRLAMAAAVLASACRGESVVESVDCVATSYPNFVEQFNQIAHRSSS